MSKRVLQVAIALGCASLVTGLISSEACWRGKPLDSAWFFSVFAGDFASTWILMSRIRRSYFPEAAGLFMGSCWFARQLVIDRWIGGMSWSLAVPISLAISGVVVVLISGMHTVIGFARKSRS